MDTLTGAWPKSLSRQPGREAAKTAAADPPAVLYHVSPAEHKQSIYASGLELRGKPGVRPPLVHASEQPLAAANSDDVWEIDTRHGSWTKTPRTGEWISDRPIPPEGLKRVVAVRHEPDAQFPMTLYRGEGSHDRPSHYPKGSSDTGGWWTSNLDSARRYAAGEKGDVYQVQVERHEAEPRGLPGYYFIPDPAVRARRSLFNEAAARWQPSSGVFGPTTGHDPRLFDGDELRPEVRRDLMERLDQALRVDTGLVGSDWQDWTKVYLAGGSASEWAGARPNDAAEDLDILIGVNYFEARRGSGAFQDMDSSQIDTAFNSALRAAFNDSDWHPAFGGTWQLTGYVNPDAYDITKIKPYAAYNITDMTWAVHPPHLPEHTLADFHPAILAEARAIATEIRAILRLPEPARTREAKVLWERIHTDRSRAFSDEGEGWEDPGNLIEKYLAYHPAKLLEQIKALVHAQPKTAALKGPLERVTAEDFAHGDPWEGGNPEYYGQFRKYNGKYLLQHSRNGLVTAHRIGQQGLVNPDLGDHHRRDADGLPLPKPRRVGYLS